MTLETLAYIAGILGAIATIWNVYFAWKNDRFNSLLPSSKEIDAIEREDIPIEKKEEKIKKYVEKTIHTIDELEIAFRSVKKMQFAKPKDDALIELVKKALSIQEYQFALNVASSAYFAVSLDQMLMMIVESAIDSNEYKIAEKASNKFHFAVEMDKAKRKIVDALGK